MGTRFTSTSVVGYNATPPSDDGSRSEQNRVKWSTINNKLTSPLKSAVDEINSKLLTNFDYGPVSINSVTSVIGSAHNNKFVEVKGAGFPVVDDASSLGAGWYVDIKNNGSQVVTLVRTTSNNTIDGTTADITIGPLEYIRLVVNAAANGFLRGNNQRGVYVTDPDYPAINSIIYLVESNISENGFHSVGASDSGAESVWSALDSIPLNARWIEIKVATAFQSIGDTAGAPREATVSVRRSGSFVSAGGASTIVDSTVYNNTSGNGISKETSIFKIPVVNRKFDIFWSSGFNFGTTIALFLTGYGY